MTATRPTNEEVFHAAREIPDPNRRREYVRTACGSDETRIALVEALLAANDTPDSLLDRPVIGMLAGGDTRTGPASPNDELSLEFLAPSPTPGSLGRLGHYEVKEIIGRGGMGIVLKAFDENLHRVVAVKMMAAPLATSVTARQRFTREARAQAAVTHDHIVTIHAVEEANGLPYIVMQCVAGQSLQDRLDRSGPLPLAGLLRIGMQVASGLAAAHAQGLVHRDIKPANILLENGVERVKLTDFGLARAADDASLTQSGQVAGTPQYMSPEQAEGNSVDHRSDLFSLGSVLYAMCTGRPPFRANTNIAVLKRVCEETATPVRQTNPEVPEWLEDVIAKLHRRNPADRYQTAAEVAELLGRHLAHVQHPSVVPLPATTRTTPDSARRSRVRICFAIAAAVLFCLACGLSLTEATGVTNLRTTVIRILTPDGTLVVMAQDPGMKVTVEGDGGLVITGAGLEEIRLRPGAYKVTADRDGKPVPLERELVSISKGGREVVKVKLEAPPGIEEILRFEEITAIPWAAAFCLDDRFVVGGNGTIHRNGKWINGADTDLRIWDAKSGKVVRRLKGHTHAALCITVAPNGKIAVSGSAEPEVGENCVARVWDLESGKELRQFTRHVGRIVAAAFLPNGRHVVTAGGYPGDPQGEIRLWDVETCEEIRQFKGHHHEVASVAIASDGKRMLTGAEDKSTILWDIESGAVLRKKERADAPSESGLWVGTVRDSPRAVLTCWDHSTMVFDLDTGKTIRRFAGTDYSVITPDGRRVLSFNVSTFKLWDVETGLEVGRLEGFNSSSCGKAISADGKEVLVQSWDPSLRLLRLPPLPKK